MRLALLALAVGLQPVGVGRRGALQLGLDLLEFVCQTIQLFLARFELGLEFTCFLLHVSGSQQGLLEVDDGDFGLCAGRQS